MANATLTVTYEGRTESFELEGTELSESSTGQPYLGNASRHFVGEEVEAALIRLTT